MSNRDLVVNRMWAVARLRAQTPDSPFLKRMWLKLKSEFLGLDHTGAPLRHTVTDPLENTVRLPILTDVVTL